ncbi:MAG: PatB family C-S lyase, partial [Victivallales bacterium]|nr:PatB family C-S lyase [Victivallales bacterium]
WDISEEWLTFIPGVVKGIGFAVNVFTKPDEKVIIQTPVYHHFRITPEGNGRQVVVNPLKLGDDGIYHMDFEHLASVVDDKCRMMILCNPHNPGGVVWDRETLARLADFCMEHHILVVSDEIHCDMTLWNNKHIPFASVSEAAARNSITLAAPTKTFNIAGVVSAYAIVPDDKIRHKFFDWLEMNEFSEPPMFSPIVALAAFQHGEQWRREMIAYLQDNIDFVIRFCEKDLPGIKALRPQASFLVWLDCRGLGMNHEQLNDFFINKAHLALNDGEMFGPGGEGFMRLNVGTPRSILMEALNRMKDALPK